VPSGATATGNVVFGGCTVTHVLHTHNLGDVPTAMVSFGDNVITPGYPLPISGGGMRFITAYCTVTQLPLHEKVMRSGAGAAESRTYDFLVFKKPPAPSGNKLFEFDPATGFLSMAKGKFNSGRKYLQTVLGGMPYFFPKGRTADANNGVFRIVDAKGNRYEPVSPG